MLLHPVAGHLVGNFETSDKTSCFAPHDANPFILLSQFELYFSLSHQMRNREMKGGLIDTSKTILLGLERSMKARCCELEFYCYEVYYCIPPINIKKHRMTRRRFVKG